MIPSLRNRALLTAGAGLSVLCLCAALPLAMRFAAADRKPGKESISLHNGWKISPAGNHHEEMGDMLLGGAVSPNGKWLAVVNGGAAEHQVHLVDTANGTLVSSMPVERAQSTDGVAFAPDGAKLYVSGGNAGRVYVFTVQENGTLTPAPPIILPNLKAVAGIGGDPGKDAGRDPARQDAPEENAYLGGLTVSPGGDTIYLTNIAGESVFALDAAAGKERLHCKLSPFDRPGAVTVTPDAKTLYVALWGRAAVLALDATTLAVKSTLRVGSHPNALRLTKDGTRLFISCGNDDSVYAFDTATGMARDKINMRLSPQSPAGSTPSALALSPDQKTLYVANSDNNDVAVVDVSEPGSSRVAGFIPTAWYPTLVEVSADGKRLFIGSGKGFGTGPNDKKRPINPVAPAGYPYIVKLLKGVLSTVDTPDEAQLARYTKQVLANGRYKDALLAHPANAPKPGLSAIPSHPGEVSPIKHVLYIIKENRTYDQVLGDLKDAHGKKLGNGDPELCLFGEKVTPNHHELAREFVTLDNLAADGEVSVDGHHWSNGAYVPDSMQRTWPSEYGSKGGTPIRYGDFGDPLAETPSGRIWDLCERAGLTYRTYYYHVDKRRSEEWSRARAQRKRDYQAADIFIRDVNMWTQKGDMPSFMVMALSEDHTSGTRAGSYTPQASVASNDLAVGKIVEACSKSPFWKEMAIFIIEDDAQNGADHVDAHRTVGLVVSPYIRRHTVDSTLYTTCSFLRTMELILGLPPMSQYDAAATPLYAAFGAKPDLTPYTCCTALIDLEAKNTRASFGAAASRKMDLSEPDHLTEQDEDTLNRILWHSIKGAKVPYPQTVRARPDER